MGTHQANLFITPDDLLFATKSIDSFLISSQKSYVMLLNRSSYEALQMSTHNICFYEEIRKSLSGYQICFLREIRRKKQQKTLHTFYLYGNMPNGYFGICFDAEITIIIF